MSKLIPNFTKDLEFTFIILSVSAISDNKFIFFKNNNHYKLVSYRWYKYDTDNHNCLWHNLL